MENIKIYKVMENDMLHKCLAIRNAVFIVEKEVPKEIEIDEYDCVNELCTHFLIRYQNNDAGTIRCLHLSKDTLKIQRFCFLKKYRNLGLGKTVIRYIENFYKEQGIAVIEMDAKYDVSGFYEKCGYKKVSAVFMEANCKHIKMMKNI